MRETNDGQKQIQFFLTTSITLWLSSPVPLMCSNGYECVSDDEKVLNVF